MGKIIFPFKEKPKVTIQVHLGYGHFILHLEDGTKELATQNDAYERGRFYLADTWDVNGFPIFERLETIKKLNALANRRFMVTQKAGKKDDTTS